MRKIFLFAALMVATLTFAADVIVLTDGSKIDAKIIEVSENEVRYKKASAPDGPTFVQKTNTITVVIYEDGETQMFSHNTAAAPAAAPASAPQQNYNRQEPQARQQNAQAQPAQNSSKWSPWVDDKFTVGFTIGYASENMKVTQKGESASGSFLLGREKKVSPAATLGLTINPTFKYGLGVRTGVFVRYAHEANDGAHGHDIAFSVPAQISFRMRAWGKLSAMIYTGPVFDFGAYRWYNFNKENTYMIEGENGKKWKGFNCLWGIGAGIQYDRFRLDLGGNFGMVNKYDDAPDGYSLKWNQPFYITATIFFGKKQ